MTRKLGGTNFKLAHYIHFQGYKKKLFPIFSHEIIISYIFIKYSTRNKYNPFDIQILIFEKNWKTDYKT